MNPADEFWYPASAAANPAAQAAQAAPSPLSPTSSMPSAVAPAFMVGYADLLSPEQRARTLNAAAPEFRPGQPLASASAPGFASLPPMRPFNVLAPAFTPEPPPPISSSASSQASTVSGLLFTPERPVGTNAGNSGSSSNSTVEPGLNPDAAEFVPGADADDGVGGLEPLPHAVQQTFGLMDLAILDMEARDEAHLFEVVSPIVNLPPPPFPGLLPPDGLPHHGGMGAMFMDPYPSPAEFGGLRDDSALFSEPGTPVVRLPPMWPLHVTPSLPISPIPPMSPISPMSPMSPVSILSVMSPILPPVVVAPHPPISPPVIVAPYPAAPAPGIVPAMPAIPIVPVIPLVPAVPAVPAAPAVPAIHFVPAPRINPAIPAIRAVPVMAPVPLVSPPSQTPSAIVRPPPMWPPTGVQTRPEFSLLDSHGPPTVSLPFIPFRQSPPADAPPLVLGDPDLVRIMPAPPQAQSRIEDNDDLFEHASPVVRLPPALPNP